MKKKCDCQYPKYDDCHDYKSDYCDDYEADDYCEVSCPTPKMKCHPTKECVKTYKCYYRLYRISYYRLYRVCPQCGHEHDYYHHRGVCPRCMM
ncbi:MAG TPA: hypothetical protein PKA28_12935 [Methylomusa anaerophila]|uniref:Uncharacterized protein n=1 Tax=Methylomusa anaerophila TaxID=1930071 RepID=A0A348AGW8_9FIRM|nr:hypothetical protein [Methylomusa anaerophila]BBB90316.1 hypothetical protein MAMMFC1_00964 [Methylomusa anaerophila]HML89338.1 hypothetical protein [Methylomusa anaerophila]